MINTSNRVLRAIVKRLYSALLILFLIISLMFIFVRIAPGDPSQRYISPKLDPRIAEDIRQNFQLDEPIFSQYFSFIGNALQGDLGYSYNYRKPVTEVIAEYFPFTFFFILASFIFQLAASTYLLYLVHNKRGGVLDKSLSQLSLVMYTMPVFITGVILVFIFSVKLKIFPVAGLPDSTGTEVSIFGSLFNYLKHLILPVLTLSLVEIALYYKYLRENYTKISALPFITALRSNGYSENTIFWKHILPNSSNPIIAIAGYELGILLGGVLIVEVLFSLPGFGRLTISAVAARDYPLILGCTMVSAVVILITNLAADLLRTLIDKRLIKGMLS